MSKKNRTTTLIAGTPETAVLEQPTTPVVEANGKHESPAPQASQAESKPVKASKCPVNRSEFASGAKQQIATLNGQQVPVDPKQFSTGSFGWYSGGKVGVMVGDKLLMCQMSLTLTVIGSKDLPQE